METTNFNNKEPKEILSILGGLFDSSLEARNLDRLQESIKIANAINTEGFDNNSLAILNYFLGNAWSYVFKIKNPIPDFGFEDEEIEKEILYYRKALELIKDCEDDFITCQILTNLGNLFSHIGRIVEAQEYFNLCLSINDKFGMAIGNRGFGLFHYARVIFEPVHQFIFLQYARKYLLESLNCSDVYKEAKQDFYSKAKYIETAYSINDLNDFKTYKNYYKDLKQEEIDYRNWCAEHKLFINPLNDIFTDSVVANDCLFMPSMVLNASEKPIYQTIYNQVKQEYVSARFLFYESLFYNNTHFSDKDVTLMDTLDYSAYSLTAEKTKIAFRVCYSLFDKIAYCLNLYFKLENKPDKVTFKNVWYKNLRKNQGLNQLLSQTGNWALRGLYWLSKDLYEEDFGTTIEPQAKEIAKIRNYIEHKSFKIVESFNCNYTEETETYEIDRDMFIEKTLKVIKLSRSALMYLAYVFYEEESNREQFRDRTTIMPVEFINLKDEYKT
ncbi:LA2681 family HEPN domain-containing protein [Dysgonomonas termitidis]|uniref:LA2681 family HEPN domain-containing protein n=1 Tax=Dysgonomonas termitidis TaxID=1516126 RepID=A0ABV9KS07_9BACT